MSKKFKIKKAEQLSNSEIFTYCVLACYSDKSGVCKATREKICEITGIKKEDTITNHTDKLVELKLIDKKYFYLNGKKQVNYEVKNISNDYVVLTSDIFKFGLKPAEIGLLIRLSWLRWKDTAYIDMSKNAIIKKLGLNKVSFKKAFARFKELYLIEEIDDKIFLNRNLFPIYVSKSDKVKKLETDLLRFDQNTKSFKMFIYAYTNQYKSINNIEGFLRWCIAGCPDRKNDPCISKFNQEYSLTLK